MKRLLLQSMLLIGIVIGSASVAVAQRPWTSVGSTGTIDEASVAIYETNGPQLRIAASAPLPASLVMRYNVVAVDNAAGVGTRMTVRFRDSGTGARVVAALKQVNVNTGAMTTLITIDSDTLPQATFVQGTTTENCSVALDFSHNAYFIEATLTKSAGALTPVLQFLSVEDAPNCP